MEHHEHGSNHAKRTGEAELPGSAMAMHHAMSRWVQPIVMLLGVWLVSSVFMQGGGSVAIAFSDAASGLALIVLGALGLRKGSAWTAYAASLVGLWLVFAPIAFWAPTAGEYANDTLLGALAVTFALLIPHGMEMEGPDIPAGWSYNPSSWPQRAPIIALAVIGFFLSRYMAAHQLGHISAVWDPFFGDGTRRVLESKVSKMWPVSDAGLGGVAYMIEILMGFMGDKRRWRTMPWMVAFFGIVVIPLGAISIILIILQPLAVGAWCSPCLLAGIAMLVMIPLTLDEVVAMLQFLRQSRCEGKSLWTTFWLGGNATASEKPAALARPDAWTPAGMLWGFATPVTLCVSVAIGLWLMIEPALFDFAGRAADSDHLFGALVIVVAVIAMAEVGRPLRFANLLLGAWIAVGGWLLGGTTSSSLVESACGLALVLLSLPLGAVREHYGRFDRALAWTLPFARRTARA